MIEYDKNEYTIKGLSTGVPNLPINIGEFKKETEKVREATEVALALDDYQSLMCKICKSLGKDDPEWRKYNELRISSIQAITMFRISLSALINSPISNPSDFNGTVNRMKQILNVNSEAVPNKDNINQKTSISKSDLPKLDETVVERGKGVVQLNQNHIDLFLQQLKTEPEKQHNNENVSRVRSLIYEIRETYEQSSILGFDIEDSFVKIAPRVRELYQDEGLKQIIGYRNTIELRNRINDLHTMIEGYIRATSKGRESKADELSTDIKIRMDEMWERLDKIDFSIGANIGV